MTPTARTLAWLRKDGWTAGVVEKWIPQTKQRLDYLGGIDIIAVRKDETVGVQATTAANQSSRCTKLLALETMHEWMAAGNKLWVVGWSKKGKAGKRKLWTPNVIDLSPSTEAR